MSSMQAFTPSRRPFVEPREADRFEESTRSPPPPLEMYPRAAAAAAARTFTGKEEEEDAEDRRRCVFACVCMYDFVFRG